VTSLFCTVHFCCDFSKYVELLIVLFVYHRCKYHRLKYGTELEQGDMIPPKFEKELTGMLH